MTSTKSSATIRHKSFTYRTDLDWAGGRAGTLAAEDRPALRIASPPEFKGEAGVWTPEDLFVAAINACTMTTFVAFAQHKKLSVTSYSSRAEGVIEFVDGGYRFTRVVLRPVVEVADAAHVDAARQALEDAHDKCIVTSSVGAEVIVEGDVRVRGSQ